MSPDSLIFQSTLSVRRATVKDHPMRWLLLFQSTLSVRRATGAHGSEQGGRDISIHALRKESDRPVAGSVPMSLRFQSTLSVRRATFCFADECFESIYFNPRSP